jgi:hypothetical protein
MNPATKRKPSVIPMMGRRKDSQVSGTISSRARTGYCPATGNLPTRITEAAFLRRCLQHQDAGKEDDCSYCSEICRGKIIPPGLEFIDINMEKNKEDSVANVKYSNGVCSVCGESRSVRGRPGNCVCTMCSILLSLAKNRPDTVFAVLTQLHPSKHFGPAQAVEKDVVEDQVSIDSQGEILSLRETIDALEEKLRRAEEDLAVAAVPGRFVELTACIEGKNRDTIVLDLAIKVITGEVVGITAETLTSLR